MVSKMAKAKSLTQRLLMFPQRQSVDWQALWSQVHQISDLYPNGSLVNRAMRLRWDVMGLVVRTFAEVGALMGIEAVKAQQLCGKGVFYLHCPDSKQLWCIGYDPIKEFWVEHWNRDSDVARLPMADQKSDKEVYLATDSELEILALAQFRQANLPEPERNVSNWIPGRKFHADFLWRFADHPVYRGLVVEVQGGIWLRGYMDRHGIPRGRGHAHPAKIEDDAEKASLGQLAGYIVLQVTEKALNSEQALDWVLDGLRIGGQIE